MSNDVVISTRGLGKRYRLGEVQAYKTLRDGMMHALRKNVTRWSRRNSAGAAREREHIWAIRDISVDIRRGEAVGIIGGNGAGKSTLLKILSRITEPTTGEGVVHGRVGSLLEVGTGFHPELTGRENIYLNGAILGMPWADIRRQFDAIVSFAEVERFVDTPIKHYSSGMYMRLAFAVAAHLEPDILMVDEVLAVGDVAFQKKCLSRMSDQASSGKTVLFVSHNLSQIQAFCERVIWLERGRIREVGSAPDLISRYLAESSSRGDSERVFEEATAPGDEDIRLARIALLNRNGEAHSFFNADEPIRVVCECEIKNPLEHPHVTIEVNTMEGVIAFGSASYDTYPDEHDTSFGRGRFRYVCEIPAHIFNRGRFSVSVWVLNRKGGFPVQVERAVFFDIGGMAHKHPASQRRRGILRPRLSWVIEPVGKEGVRQ